MERTPDKVFEVNNGKLLNNQYRSDIDGLRTIAVISVIIFHFGYLPYGYLGVDIFFVISGYLITKIIAKETEKGTFSLANFYVRRIRRILPLVLLITVIALLIGYFVMLPDDLENLVQSIVATNLFSNNILQYITTGNYWDVVNEYKPLMHTWSLGVEEQFYVFYPLIFLIFGKSNKLRKFILPSIIFLTIVSLILFLSPSFNDSEKFYLLPFRFFEIAIGGIGALVFKEKLFAHKYTNVIIFVLLALLFLDFNFVSDDFRLVITVFVTLILLLSQNSRNKLLSNKVMVYIGKISFSLYLWHQLVIAYTRYTLINEIDLGHVFVMTAVIFFLSVISYHWVEQPFRNKNKIKTPRLLKTLSFGFILTTAFSLMIYTQAGVVRDVPELGISEEHIERGLHSKFNDRIYDLDKAFSDSEKIKVFIIGNSFARDWANVLLKSDYSDNIEVTYTFNLSQIPLDIERLNEAELIFFSELEKTELEEFKEIYNIDESKVWNIGTKNFGENNGIYYSQRGSDGYFEQRTEMMHGVYDKNLKLKSEWGDKYVDLISLVIDENKKVPVFTSDSKFISQDTRHFTEAGAEHFASLIDSHGVLEDKVKAVSYE